jgi:hypothetical protein
VPNVAEAVLAGDDGRRPAHDAREALSDLADSGDPCLLFVGAFDVSNP